MPLNGGVTLRLQHVQRFENKLRFQAIQVEHHSSPSDLISLSTGALFVNTATAVTIAALAALTPTVTCLIGIILSRQDVRDLRSEMNVFRGDLERFRAEIREDMLAMRKDVHADLLMIHERVANVEGRQSR